MAIHPNPDNVPHIMQEDFGTRVLITDLASEKYLERHREKTLTKRSLLSSAESNTVGTTTPSVGTEYIQWLLERGEWWTL